MNRSFQKGFEVLRPLSAEVPELAALISVVEDMRSDCSFGEFVHLQDLFEACLSSDVMLAVMRNEWEKNPTLALQKGSEDHLVLWSNEECGLMVRLLGAGLDHPKVLFGSSSHTMIGLVTPRSKGVSLDVLVTRWAAEDLDTELFDPHAELPEPKVHRINPGGSIALEAPNAFHAIMPAATELLCAALNWRPSHRYRWDVSLDTLKPKRIVCVDDDALRAASCAAILGRLPAKENTRTLGALVFHEDHNVRWEATRSLFRLDRALGLTALRRIAEGDAHLHLRETALLALQGVREAD